MPWYGWHGWWMGWMWVFWIIIAVALVWILFRATPAPRNPPEARITPEEILRQRYARGEIGTEEYQHRLEVLRRGGHNAA